jgi:hypothetical protein
VPRGSVGIVIPVVVIPVVDRVNRPQATGRILATQERASIGKCMSAIFRVERKLSTNFSRIRRFETSGFPVEKLEPRISPMTQMPTDPTQSGTSFLKNK